MIALPFVAVFVLFGLMFTLWAMVARLVGRMLGWIIAVAARHPIITLGVAAVVAGLSGARWQITVGLGGMAVAMALAGRGWRRLRHQGRTVDPGLVRQRHRVPSPTVLYRFFDESGTLLYVGISNSVTRRIAEHHDQPWARSWTSMTGSPYPDRTSAERAERMAIRNENPLYNKVHSRRRPNTRTLAAR